MPIFSPRRVSGFELLAWLSMAQLPSGAMGCRTPSNVERRPVGPRDREAAVSPSSHPPKPPENPRVARPPPTDTRLVEGCASELELGADPAETLRRLGLDRPSAETQAKIGSTIERALIEIDTLLQT